MACNDQNTDTFSATERLVESLHRATLHAAQVMSDWTQGRILVALDEVREVPLESIANALALGWEPVTMVRVGITGPASGELILTLPHSSARRLTNLLIQRDDCADEEWSELQISAAMETGNVFASAYLNELACFAGCDLLPTPPAFLQDFAASVIQQAALMQAAETDRLVIGRIRFELDGDALDCHIVVILSVELLRRVSKETASA